MPAVRRPRPLGNTSHSSLRRARQSGDRVEAAKLAPGLLVAGRFRVERRIAAGGMGEVWAADHCATGMRVALKTLRAEVSANPEVVQRFKREAVLLGRVRSDRVARVIDFFEDARYGAILVTEFIEGRSLADAAEAPAPLTVEQGVELGIEIALALRDLHQTPIVHRDLKPGNVILQPLEDGRTRAVLVDLGVSRLLSPDDEQSTDALTEITRTNICLGTVGYMAPEQILGPREVTAAADLYSLGAMLFRLVGGHNVFDGMTRMEQLRTKLQEEAPRLRTGRTDALARGLEAVVSRALEREPTLRYASADEMATTLSALRKQVRSAPAEGSSRPRRRFGWVAAIAATAAFGCAATGTAYRARTAPPLPASLAVATPAPPPEPPSRTDTEVESPGDGNRCVSADTFGSIAAQASKDAPAASSRRAAEAGPLRDQRARDAALIRAIRSAVAAESYKTLVIASPDDLAPAWVSSSTTPAYAAAGR